MDRRAFLTGLGGGVAGAAVTRPSRAVFAQGEPLISTYVSNVPQTAGDTPLPSRGEAVLVCRDEAHKYDPHALAVTTQGGSPLGYVPPIHSRIIEPILSSGYKALAWVEISKSSPRPQLRIALVLQPPGVHHV